METDAETQCKHKTERDPNADMWQFRNLHIPKRKKKSESKPELLAEQ
ncbi:MAG TPA: hypothetical protein VLH35_01140 [Candidatus Acidoferrales bacterium]|nr:hypothetical protein [Candidatus Acidoferrales bacterium]